jgi:CheY-like chemotaxis protein
MTLRLLIVDDNAHFLEAATGLLEREGIRVVGVASTTLDALRSAEDLRPDVTLVDVDLGEESGFDLTLRLTEARPEDRPLVILISAYTEQDLGDLIATSPAVGFLPKSFLSAKAIVELLGRANRESPSEEV